MVSRRSLFIGGAAVAAVAVGLTKPGARSGAYTDYFAALNKTLRANGIDRPSLVIDLDRLDRNIDRVAKSAAMGTPRNYRVVIKSLPAPQLIDYVCKRAKTRSGMVFHRPFLEEMAKLRPDADLLFGKPMPLAAVAHFYDGHKGPFDPVRQLQWLIDTDARLAQYLDFAKARKLTLRISLEIDVGLHRGGFADPAALGPALKTIAENPQYLEFGGFMGYDAHVGGLPGFIATQEIPRVKQRYAACVELLKTQFAPLAAGKPTFNGAGSPTFRNYEAGDSVVNDISVGTALMKPTHYDLPILEEFEPSAFIATPVLKRIANRGVPTFEWARNLLKAWDPNTADMVFAYSGNWLAEPESPPGLQHSGIYVSSNQEGYYASPAVKLEVDDFFFLRPTQSEAVLLQFGDLVAVRGSTIEARWPVLPVGV